tara:strand:- start:4 stop:192 length:189 start_codon:yes stop_codon:yes gene_type:complete
MGYYNLISHIRKLEIMTEKEILNKIIEWLKLNINSEDINNLPNLKDDNKFLLNAIEDWKKQK